MFFGLFPLCVLCDSVVQIRLCSESRAHLPRMEVSLASPRSSMEPEEAQTPGGIVHTYQKYDPVNFPSPTAPPPDMVSPLFDHLLTFGDMDEFTEEQLRNAIHLDPSQIVGFGPSLNAMKEMLLERKRKILETYETKQVRGVAKNSFHDAAK